MKAHHPPATCPPTSPRPVHQPGTTDAQLPGLPVYFVRVCGPAGPFWPIWLDAGHLDSRWAPQ